LSRLSGSSTPSRRSVEATQTLSAPVVGTVAALQSTMT
jgi:hypothetical protein